MPKELISSSELQALKLQRSPSFIPLHPEADITRIHDGETGIIQLCLSNGILINYRVFPSLSFAEFRVFLFGDYCSRSFQIIAIKNVGEGGLFYVWLG